MKIKAFRTWSQPAKIISISIYALLVYLLFFQFDAWFDATLYRHIAGEFSCLILLGWIGGKLFLSYLLGSEYPGVHYTVLLFFVASVGYWMLPVSIDMAALHNNIDLILAINLWLAGCLLGSQFHKIQPEIKFTFLFMMATMLAVTGLILSKLNLLLCGTYSIWQQKILAKYLIVGGLVILLLSLISFGAMLSKREDNQPELNPSK